MSFIVQPLAFEFFRQGVLASLLVGALCGMLGVYIVLRRMSYIGHGLSHSVFGGAVIAYVASLNFYVGAGLWGFFSALLINATARRRRIGADAAIGIITTASFAVGVALISKTRSFTRNFEAALFGNILGVTPLDLVVVAAVTIGVAAFILLFYKRLLFMTFDPEVAAIQGVEVGLTDSLFALAMAATIVASINVVGVTLIAATLVIPSSTARLLTDSFGRMLVLSTVFGAVAGLVGMYLSYWLDVSSGATIVLLEAAAFLAVFAATTATRRRTGWADQRIPVLATDRPADDLG
ncbi:MAG: manganese/iron transport system permease protein [Chloroflexota bacterium]|jgi:ABC-type Mn2+/Zn2+ transport system permease subunit|nr:manganese/iron transport system permease protein [Chloroflexota bacterium]